MASKLFVLIALFAAAHCSPPPQDEEKAKAEVPPSLRGTAQTASQVGWWGNSGWWGHNGGGDWDGDDHRHGDWHGDDHRHGDWDGHDGHHGDWHGDDHHHDSWDGDHHGDGHGWGGGGWDSADAATLLSTVLSNDSQSQTQFTECGCMEGTCKCIRSNSSVARTEEEQQVEEVLLNQTKELNAWWAAQESHAGRMQCSCAGGGNMCQCGHAAAVAGQNASFPTSAGENFTEALRNETEQLLSLWWVAHGGRHGWGRGYGYGGGWGHVGYVGCGCRFYGCRCGGIRYGGYR